MSLSGRGGRVIATHTNDNKYLATCSEFAGRRSCKTTPISRRIAMVTGRTVAWRDWLRLQQLARYLRGQRRA